MDLVHSLRRMAASALLLVSAGAFTPVHAQSGGVVRGTVARPPTTLRRASRVIDVTPPITTSLTDAKFGSDSLDGFTPREPKRSLTTLQRTADGGFLLQPGYYELRDQSYSLGVGTYAPGGSDGYLYAPPLGRAEEAVESVVRNSVQHPEIQQHDVQVVLWAIIARSNFDDLPAGIKANAARLLTQQELATLNGTAVDVVPGAVPSTALAVAPSLAGPTTAAEANLRAMLINPSTSYSDLERVAVLAGAAPIGPGSRSVPAGRWSLHPDGYYVRYQPLGYTNTIVQIWVRQGSSAVGKEYDPATHIAVAGNTSRQRLIQSGRIYSQ